MAEDILRTTKPTDQAYPCQDKQNLTRRIVDSDSALENGMVLRPKPDSEISHIT